MIEREIFEKCDKLSEYELNTKSKKNVYVENDVINTIIECCRGEKKEPKEKIYGFRKKLMIPEYENPDQIKNRKHICEQKNTRRIFC